MSQSQSQSSREQQWTTLGYRVMEQKSSTGLKGKRTVAVDALRSTAECDQYKKLPFLLQAEIHRFISPQGPLQWQDLKGSEICKFVPRPLPPSPPSSCNERGPLACTASLPSPSRSATNTSTRTEPDISNEREKVLAKSKALYEYLTSVCIAKGLAEHDVRPCNAEFFAGLQALEDDGFSESYDRCPNIRGAIDWDAQYDMPTFRLMPPVIGRYTRFMKMFGWDRWLRVVIPEEVEKKCLDNKGQLTAQGKALKDFLERPLRIANNVYRAVLYKTGTLHYFLEEGVESWHPSTDTNAKSFHLIRNFADYHIPPELNGNMSVGKYVARFNLGLSKTIPTISFKLSQIRRVPDVTSNSLAISFQFLQKVSEKLGIDYVPSCIRGSVTGKSATWRLIQPSLASEAESQYISVHRDMFEQDTRGRDRLNIDFSVLHEGKHLTWTMRKKRCTGEDEGWLQVIDSDWPGEGSVMTDGWGTLSKSAATEMRKCIGLEEVPAVFQARFGGNKGLWTVSPLESSRHEPPWIEVHDSQHKFEESASCDFNFEVVRWSTKANIGYLSHQIIPILGEQGVPNETFVNLMTHSAKEKVAALTSWQPEARSQLRRAVEVSTNLANTRAKASQTSKLLNTIPSVRSYKRGEQEDVDLVDASAASNSTDDLHADIMNLYSCVPPGLGEQTIQMLDAGFMPLDNPFLAEKIKKVHDDDLAKCVGYRIPIPKSTNLFVMVDPIGCLQEGEIFCQLSQGFVDEETGERMTTILGEVLVTRDPCVLPTDVRKVRAVNREELRGYYDVIVFPVVGHRALCSLLGGGDYDGDTIRLIFDESIVKDFNNAPLHFADPTFEMSDYFDSHTETIQKAIGSQAARATAEDALQAEEKRAAKIAGILLAPLFAPAHYGQLANYHLRQIYLHSASHPESRLLAQLFAIALDASKQSMQMNLSKFDSLSRFKGPAPRWTSKLVGEDKTAEDIAVNWAHVPRDKHLGESPMDALFNAGLEVETIHKTDFHNLFKRPAGARIQSDKDLTREWRRARESGRTDTLFNADLDRIEENVESCQKAFQEAYQNYASGSTRTFSSLRQQRRDAAQKRRKFQIDIAAVGRQFAQFPDPRYFQTDYLKVDPYVLRRLKASCLYGRCSMRWRSLGIDESKWAYTAPFMLAFRDLNNMKADAFEANLARKRSCPGSFESAGEGYRAQSIISETSRNLFTRPLKKARLA